MLKYDYFICLQDLSQFAMPLMETGGDSQSPMNPLMSSMDSVDGEFRPRSGSTGIRGLFSSKDRHRKKSGEENTKVNSPSTSSKVKNFFDSIRPRSKSDLSGIKKPNKRAIAAARMRMDQSMDESSLSSALNNGDVNVSLPTNTALPPGAQGSATPMGAILTGQLTVPNTRQRHQSGPPTSVDQFNSRYRPRAMSDSKQQRPNMKKVLIHQVCKHFCLVDNRNLLNELSLVMRKPAFCICENKDAYQLCRNREADQRLCFR